MSENWWKSMKIANIDAENLHIFWTTWRTSMKYSGITWLMIILKVTKKQFHSSLEDDSNKLVIGEMNPEIVGVGITEFVRLKPNIYSFLVDNDSQHKKAKLWIEMLLQQ